MQIILKGDGNGISWICFSSLDVDENIFPEIELHGSLRFVLRWVRITQEIGSEIIGIIQINLWNLRFIGGPLILILIEEINFTTFLWHIRLIDL